MRLLLPGYEGNMNVKYLRRIKLVEEPAMSYWEAKIYSPILPNGKAYQFYLLQEVKSFITLPSPGLNLKEPGLYERPFGAGGQPVQRLQVCLQRLRREQRRAVPAAFEKGHPRRHRIPGERV
jgi:hypothetical protein